MVIDAFAGDNRTEAGVKVVLSKETVKFSEFSCRVSVTILIFTQWRLDDDEKVSVVGVKE